MKIALSRREVLSAAALAFVHPMLGRAAESAFALVTPHMASSARRLVATPMGAYALRNAQRALPRVPRPMPVVHTEGTLPGQGIYDDSVQAKGDWLAALDSALGAALTGDAAMAAKAIEFWTAWLPVYRISLNPIDESDVDQMLLAFDLLPESARDRAAGGVLAFCRRIANGYLDAMLNVRGGTAINNWQSHRVKLATLAAFAVGDATLVERARAAFRKQIDDNIRSDGSVLDFGERDALRYVVYDLEPLAVAALAAMNHGANWYADGNNALQRALEWLAPYAGGTKTHEEYVRSTVAFDRERAAAKLPGFGGQWNRQGAEYLYGLASRLDPQFRPIAAALTPGFEGTRRPRAPWLHLTLPE